VNGNGIPALTQHVEQEPSTVTVSPVNSPDGSVGVVVGTYYGTAHVFALGASAFTGPTVVTSNPTEDAVWSVRFSPSGSLFLTGDDQIRFWSFPDGAPILPDISFGGANDLSFSPDGKYVAAAGTFGDPKVSLFAVSNHAETARHVFDDDADSIVFSPSGTAVIGGLDDCGKVFVCSD
jgi:WD40 repeat protein